MRKERLIVPILAAVAVIWMVAQLLSSVLFERSLRQALEDLEARGEWRVSRIENHQGWLTSRGGLVLSPLLGRPWRLELTYRARHGVLSTDGKISKFYLQLGESGDGIEVKHQDFVEYCH